MLRRPPTALAISADDLAAYDLRHQARLAAHARSLAQQREQEASEQVIPPELQNHAAAAPAPRPHPSSQQYQQHQQRLLQRQQQAADAAVARPRRLHAPGAIQTGSPGAPHDDHDDDGDGAAGMGMSMGMGMSLDGPPPTRSIPGATAPAPRRRRPSEAASSSGEDNNIHSGGNGVERDNGDQAERVPLAHGANAAGHAGTQPGRANRAVRADAERRRLLERERILGRGHNDGGGGGDSARRQHQGGSGVVGERAPRR